MGAQLPLGLELPEHARFENFNAGPNAGALAAALACASGREPSLLFLWGAAGTGRSHLLQAACHHAAIHDNAVAYVPLAESAALSVEMVGGMEESDLVCIDDIDLVAGQPSWERALFGVVNGVLENGAKLLVSAVAPPAECGLQLADLVSRLSLSAVFRLVALDDEQKLSVLRVHANAKGLELSDDAGRYLLRHYRRDLPALFALLERLDRESLAAQRRLTVPFMREVLGRGESNR